ncbi:hypothetical protein FAI40_01790 [Acetobacteraceae bacterium]|nr:hypothetical protein FAI40_01790 [Acetobacteraceae bacterium]
MNTYFVVLHTTQPERTEEVLEFLKTVGKVKSLTKDDFPAWFVKTDLILKTLSDEIYNRTLMKDNFAIINLPDLKNSKFLTLTENFNWLDLA